jgi:hypothetical protein
VASAAELPLLGIIISTPTSHLIVVTAAVAL